MSRSSVVLLLLSVAGCAGGPISDAGRVDDVMRGTWVLQELGGHSVLDLAEFMPTLRFGADGAVSGSDGCNRLRGNYESEGAALSFIPIASTRMGCTRGEALAQAFAAAMSITRSYELQGGTLSLFDGDGQVIMRFAQGDG